MSLAGFKKQLNKANQVKQNPLLYISTNSAVPYTKEIKKRHLTFIVRYIVNLFF